MERVFDSKRADLQINWKLLLHIVVDVLILIIVFVVLLSIYRSCTRHQVTQLEMDAKRIIRDTEGLQDAESMFVPIVSSNFQVVAYPAKDCPIGTKKSCICVYQKGSSTQEYCGEIRTTAVDCKGGLCVESLQRVDVEKDQWVTISRANNKVTLKKTII
jgi:hypothetical protein